MTTAIYLDNNEWNYLFSHGRYSETSLATIRRQLMKRVADGQIRVVASLPLFQEIVRTERRAPRKYEVMSQLLFNVVGERWLIPLNQRYLQEAASGGVLPEARRYLERSTRRKLRSLSTSTLREIGDEMHLQGKRFKTEQEEIRRHLRLALPEMVGTPSAKIGRVIDDWWRQEVNIEDWVRGLVGESVVTMTGVNTPVHRPLSELLPSAWHFMSFKLARIKRNLGDGRTIATSDYIDAEHYAAGPYTDVIVSDDAEFARTCTLLEARAFKLERFEDLVARIC